MSLRLITFWTCVYQIKGTLRCGKCYNKAFIDYSDRCVCVCVCVRARVKEGGGGEAGQEGSVKVCEGREGGGGGGYSCQGRQWRQLCQRETTK